ncbi:FkbM family methyltransferase [Hoeflea prorocentri]|uniref:FkbM family methyltransferase n=1 Tax=Hoeflea prorocentri TaxID=1922333 RepID=UPI00227D2007|nr:FkbM family methyltransferase [Hoeflea prorocentri]MCY6380800.1 FkbM family methyltransferase [Hoeflea prorocentri]
MKVRELDLISEFGARRPGIAPRLIWKLATHRNINRKTRKYIRKNFARGFPGPYDVEAEGVHLRAYPMENYCDRIAVGRGRLPEIPERQLIGPYLKPGMVFVDIGANIGTYSLFVAERCGGDARILAFEPHPRTFAKLSFNIKANGGRCIEAVNQGVGVKNERLRLYSSGGTNIGTASILPEAATDHEFVEVRIAPLAATLKNRLIERIDLLKIDIEGFEDRARLPLMSEENRPHWPGAVLIETVLKQHWQSDCISELESLGYRIAGDTGENLLLLHPMTEKLES